MHFSTNVTGAHYLSTAGVKWGHLAEVVFVRCIHVIFPHFRTVFFGRKVLCTAILKECGVIPYPLEREDNIGFEPIE